MQFQVLLLVMTVGLAMAHENGAPLEACNDLTPQHEVTNKGLDSQVITVVPHQDCYKAGTKVMVQVTAKDKEIEGILAVANEVGDTGNTPVGTWVTGPKLKHLACSSKPKSAITHSAELETYGTVGLVWEAPDNFDKGVTFRVTVVYHKDEYWVDRKSTTPLTFKADCAAKSYTVPVYVDKDGKPRSSGAASITVLSTVSMIIMALLSTLL